MAHLTINREELHCRRAVVVDDEAQTVTIFGFGHSEIITVLELTFKRIKPWEDIRKMIDSLQHAYAFYLMTPAQAAELDEKVRAYKALNDEEKRLHNSNAMLYAMHRYKRLSQEEE